MHSREDLDQGRLPGAVVAEYARHLTGIHVRRDVLQRHDVAVVLGDVVCLEEVRHGHLARCARLRMSVLSITAANRIAPWNVKVQLLSHCESTIPSCTIPSIAAPKNVPMTDPKPPVSRQPPTTAQMMKMNSRPMPSPACIERSSSASIVPISAAVAAVIMKSRIFVRATGTPTLRAELGSPPAP